MLATPLRLFWRWLALANPVTIKRTAFDIAKATLPDFTATWGFTTREPPRLWLYMGDMQWPSSQWQTNRSRQHEMTSPLILNALTVRKSAEESEAWILEQLNALEDAFGADSALREAGVITWELNPRQVGTQPSTDGGIEAQAVFELRVTYRP